MRSICLTFGNVNTGSCVSRILAEPVIENNFAISVISSRTPALKTKVRIT